MNRRTFIDIVEIRIYSILILTLLYFIMFKSGLGIANLYVTAFSKYLLILRGHEILFKMRLFRVVKRQIQTSIFPTFAIWVWMLTYHSLFDNTYVYFIVFIFLLFILPTKYICFSKKVFFEKKLIPVYVLCKKYYIDIIAILIAHLHFKQLAFIENSCFHFIDVLLCFIVFLLLASLWFMLFKLIKRTLSKFQIIFNVMPFKICSLLYFILLSSFVFFHQEPIWRFLEKNYMFNIIQFLKSLFC